MNCPLPPNECPSSGSEANHSVVHSFEPSDHGPSQPASPQGSSSTTNRLPRISTALTTEWERLPTRPSTVAFFTPLLTPSRVLNQHPNSRSWFALTSSSLQNLSGSRMSCLRVSRIYVSQFKQRLTLARRRTDTPLARRINKYVISK